MIRAIAWTGAAKWAIQLFAWTSTIIVARILSPSDYGLFGMATIYLGLVALISEFGLGQAVVVLREMSHQHIRQINTLSVVFGGVLFALSCAAAVPLGHFFHAAKLAAVIVVMSLSFLISGAQVVPDALLQRALRFKLLASFDTFRAITQLLTTIVMAWLGFRYWSLALGSLAGVLVGCVLLIAASPCAFSWPHPKEINKAIRFSTDVLGSRLAWYAYSNSDFMVAGRRLGQAALGAYTVAWTIASTPVEKITNMVTRVTPAFFSAVQHDNPELRRYLLRITEGLALFTFPASFGMALVADQFVLCVLGPKWIAAVIPLRLLAILAAMRSITTLFPSILFARRHSRFVMWNTVIAAVVFPAAFYYGSRWSTTGIALAWILLYPVITTPFIWRTFQEIELPVGTYLQSLAPALRACLVMTVTVVAVRLAMPLAWPLAMRFAISVLSGTLAYTALLALVDRRRLREFYAVLKSARSESI
jgi:PST family polysaccharide transporter